MATTNLSRTLTVLLTVGMSMILTACGGGGGGSASTSSTSITARGAITGFGSIYVNGVRYHTGSSSVTIDDNPGVESDLKLGMVVTVSGTRNDDSTGTASSIVFDNELQGPVANLTIDPDGVTKIFTVLGISVTVDRVSTSFHDISFDTLADGDLVEVSGFYDGSLVLNASFLERKSAFTPGVSEVEIKGTVSNSAADSFQVNGIVINYDATGAATDLSDLPGGVSDGIFVEVKGTLDNAGEINATRVAAEDSGFDDNMNKVSVEGIITDYVDDSNFKISDTPIDASSAIFTPSTLSLGNGVKVEAEGPLVSGTLQALEIGSRGGDEVKIEAQITSVSTADSSITLNLINGSVTAFVDSRTRMDDNTGSVSQLSLSDLSSGDFVEVRGMIDDSDRVILNELRRDDDDDLILQGQVESFVAGSSITILGVTYPATTGATEFEDINDAPISSATFYSNLSVGSLVKIKDDQPGDGTADEAEFED